MTVQELYLAIQGTPLGQFMLASTSAFTVCETLHFIGLCILLGALMVVDLRLLGVMKSTPASIALKFVPVAVFGFMINLLTGLCFISFNPEGYFTNWMFWTKMGLVSLAGLNAIYFTFVEQPRVLRTPQGETFDAGTRITAALSLALWVAVIVAGRLLPVTQGAAGSG